MKKIVLFVMLFVALNTFTFIPGFTAEEPDLKPAFLELQNFVAEQNEYLFLQLEPMISFLGEKGSYNQVQKIKQAATTLLESSRKNLAATGEILKKEKLSKKDVIMYLDKIKLSLATIMVINYTYQIILTNEKKKLDDALKKLQKEIDNHSG